MAASPRVPLRRGIATLASLVIALRLLRALDHESCGYLATTVAVPLAAGALIWGRALIAQLVARGAWWSMLLTSCLLAISTPVSGSALAASIAACSAIALLAVGGSGLEHSDDRFAPVAFRGTLLVALVLAIADASALSWFGIGNLYYEHRGSVLLVTPFMFAGVVGLLRLRTWGLVVSVATNAALVVLIATEVVYLPTPLRALFIGTSVLQLAIPVPMLVSILTKRPPAARPSAVTRVGPMLAIVAIAALAFVPLVTHRALLHW